MSPFALKEGGPQAGSFALGQMVYLNESNRQPDPGVKSYPALKSSKPIYGSVRFGQELDGADSGTPCDFVLDESGGTGKGYDRLYLDLSRRRDLSDAEPVTLQDKPQESARLNWNWITQQSIFNDIILPVPVAGPSGFNSELMPRLVWDKAGGGRLCFVNAKVHVGTIQVNGASFNVALGEDYSVGGRLDRPSAALHFRRIGGGWGERWWGADRLKAFHVVNGAFFKFSATASGDELTAAPYTGDLGFIELRPGARKLSKMEISGSLDGRDSTVPVGETEESGTLSPSKRYAVPVGDYRADYLGVTYGTLAIEMSYCYHSDGKPRDMARAARYPIAIRKGKPFILDFSNKPEVVFASPAKGIRLKTGDTLEVKAVLTDPKLDIMIRGLRNASTRGAWEDSSLDPKVVVTRADGTPVAEGLLPFG